MNYRHCWIFIVFLCVTSFAQDISPVSLRTWLEHEQTLVAMDALPETETLEGFSETREYAMQISSEGAAIPLTMWLSRWGEQTHASYVIVSYEGSVDAIGVQAMGYLFHSAGNVCLNMYPVTNDIGEFESTFVSNLSSEWQTLQQVFGDITITLQGQLSEQNLSLILSAENISEPGVNSWQLVCPLE